jgi:hypothetical protein
VAAAVVAAAMVAAVVGALARNRAADKQLVAALVAQANPKGASRAAKSLN